MKVCRQDARRYQETDLKVGNHISGKMSGFGFEGGEGAANGGLVCEPVFFDLEKHAAAEGGEERACSFGLFVGAAEKVEHRGGRLGTDRENAETVTVLKIKAWKIRR